MTVYEVATLVVEALGLAPCPKFAGGMPLNIAFIMVIRGLFDVSVHTCKMNIPDH